MSTLTIDSAPHLRAKDDIARIMWHVVVALVPALIAAAFFFGWYALVLVALSVVTAVAAEGVIQKLRRVPVTIGDGSAVVTGILLAFVIPADAPLYVPVVGSFFAIAVVKQCFGGLGCNIWNPALGARALLHFAYPAVFNAGEWAILRPGRWIVGTIYRTGDAANEMADAVTQATPLNVLKTLSDRAADALDTAPWQRLFSGEAVTVGGEEMRLASPIEMFLGEIPGCIGEVSAAALILGGIYLLARKRIKWQVPVLYVGTVFVLTAALPASGLGWFPGLTMGVRHLLAGGLMLGAIYMATDMVTSPITVKGQIIFAVGCGVLTALIRRFGGYPEGVCFAILLMNTAVPLIDRCTQPRVFGVR